MEPLRHTRDRGQVQSFQHGVVVVLGQHDGVPLLGGDVDHVTVGQSLLHIAEQVPPKVRDICVGHGNHSFVYIIAYTLRDVNRAISQLRETT